MNSDPTWVEDLLKTNQPPSEEVAQDVRRLLFEPSKELEHLDREISDLENRLSQLESRRTNTQKQIARYELILSPIRRIPPDVLGEIFYHCLPTHRDPVMVSSDCPLVLTRVCSIWREAAMTTPKLWDRLYITFTDEDTVPDLESLAEKARNGEVIDGWRNAQTLAIKQKTTVLLRKRYEAVREWFRRSGTRPLSLSLYLTTSAWYTVPYSERPPSVTMEFLSFLVSLAPRWKSLEVKSPMRIYKALEDMLPISQMAGFTSLRAEFHPQYPEDADANRPLRLMSAPNLRQLSMSAGHTSLWGLADRSFTQWHNLTHLTCLNTLTVPETIFLLKHSTNLIHYKGIISEYPTDTAPMVYEGDISLPFLRSLSITEYLSPRRLGNIYDWIDAPKLHWVTYFSQFSIDEYSVLNPPPIPILSLLRRATELHYLSLDVTDFAIWDLGTVLRAVPSLQDLVIGQDSNDLYLPMVASRYTDYTTSGFLTETLWSFSELIVGSSSDKLEKDTPLLPRLKSLTISSPTAYISDDILFDLIKSRMESSTAAVLKHVKVIFSREMNRNISEELSRFGESGGGKIHLDLHYALAPPSILKSTAPSFGLRNSREGQSWPYIDAGEYV